MAMTEYGQVFWSLYIDLLLDFRAVSSEMTGRENLRLPPMERTTLQRTGAAFISGVRIP